MKNYEERLKELGIEIPDLPPPAGAYIPAVKSGNLVFCSGQGPSRDGKLVYTGKLGAELTLEEGYQAARICALNCLAEICSVIGSINNIVKIIQVRGFIASTPDFFEHPRVLNGASELLIDIFGDAGKHTRCALGTSVLPKNIPIEVEMLVEVKI